MKRLLSAAILIVITFLFQTHPLSAEERRFIDDSALPITGTMANDFTVPGWSIESTTEGDLNKDQRTDVVLTLIEILPTTSIGQTDNTRYRALVVLLKSAQGSYQRLAVAKKLLRCSSCYGMLGGPEGGSPEIKISKGVVTVDEMWGSRETMNTHLSFRFDKKSNRMQLIGEDISTHDRVTGESKNISSNFLTRLKLTDSQRYDEKRDRMVSVSQKKQRLKVPLRYIEDIDYEHY